MRRFSVGFCIASGWGGSGWGTYIYPWLIHVNVWQKPLQCYKVISLQFEEIKKKKKDWSPKRSNHDYKLGTLYSPISAVRLERLETFYIASIKLLNYGVESFQTDQQIHVLKGLYTPDYTLQLPGDRSSCPGDPSRPGVVCLSIWLLICPL